MYLQAIARDNLLPDLNSGSHVLKGFESHVAKEIVQAAVKNILETSNIQNLIQNDEHLIWSMECIGHAFTLPMTEIEVLMGAKTIYSRWILESAPKPFSKNFELYLEKALCHLSLAFEERKYSGGNSLEKHIEYCKQILDVYSEVIRCIGSRLSCKHWNTILRILLGISTYILEVPISSQGISNELTDQMLRTLFDCLIQSKTKTSDHWSLLSEYTQRWIHREQLVVQMNCLRRALTHKLPLIDENESSNILLDFRWNDGYRTKVAVDSQELIFFWYQLICLCGDPNKIKDPRVMLTTVKGIAEWVSYFWCVDRKSSHPFRFIPTSGKSMLRAFGRLLFPIASRDLKGFENSRAYAMGALCQIFCNCSPEDFSNLDVSCFYDVLIRALNEPSDRPVVHKAIRNSTSLFSGLLPASRYLIPYFLPHLRRIFEKSANSTLAHLRFSSLQIISSLLSVSNNFIATENDSDFCKQVVRNQHQLFSLPSILINALQLEKDSYSLQLILHQIAIYLHEDHCQSFAFAEVATQALWNCLNENRWSLNVSISAIYLLSNVCHLFKDREKTHASIFRSLIGNISKYIRNILEKLSINSKREVAVEDYDLILSVCYSSLTDHLVAASWALNDPQTANEVTEVTLLGVHCKGILHRTRHAARILQDYILFDVGQEGRRLFDPNAPNNKFSDSLELSIIDLLMQAKFLDSSKKYLNDEFLKSTVMRYFRFGNNFIFTIVQLPPSNVNPTAVLNNLSQDFITNPSSDFNVLVRKRWIQGYLNRNKAGKTLILVRTPNGRFLWEGSPIMLPRNHPSSASSTETTMYPFENVDPDYKPHDYKPRDILKEAAHRSTDLLNELDADSVLRQSSQANAVHSVGVYDWWKENEFDSQKSQEINRLIQKTESENSKYFNDVSGPKYSSFSDLHAPVARPLKKNAHDFSYREARMLLSQIGLIHPFFREEGSDSFEILFPSEKLNEGLLVLDQTPAHEIMTIGVLYGRVGQSTIKQMLCNDSASPEFLTFVKNLGTEVGVEFCKSFSGGVTTQDVRTIHVHSDHTMDVFFHVPSLMICDYNRRRDLFLSNLVRVVWKEDPGVILLKKTFKLPKYLEMQLSKKDVEFPIIYIFIQPVGSRLYRIEIDDSSLIGKVANNLVVEHSSSFLQDRGASAWPRTGTLDGDKGGANDSFYLSGPLVNNCVVRDAMLPQLVRKTSINYMKRVLDQFADRLDPYSQRSKIIQSMCADHSSAAPTGVFYRSFFQHQLDDQLKKFIRH